MSRTIKLPTPTELSLELHITLAIRYLPSNLVSLLAASIMIATNVAFCISTSLSCFRVSMCWITPSKQDRHVSSVCLFHREGSHTIQLSIIPLQSQEGPL